jgi:hypothetical protein
MNSLFAHHLEPHHFPVLIGMFAAGFYIGWTLLSRWTTSPAPKNPVGERRG